jgi:ankyrin repeat protein
MKSSKHFFGIIYLVVIYSYFIASCSKDYCVEKNPFLLIEKANLICFEKFLREGGNANCLDKNQDSLLIFSLANRLHQSKFVGLLLRYGANPNFVPVGKDPPLVLAAIWADEKSVKMLLENGANLDLKGIDGKSVLDSVANAGESSLEIKNMLMRYATQKHHD